MTLSIVIPVYNREAYVAETLHSILRQQGHTLSYEVVLVDDGSTDGSVAVCEQMAAAYPCVRLCRQTNQGPGAARNLGVQQAQGDYVWLFDSDDLMADGALATLEPHLRRADTDAVTFAAATMTAGALRRRFSYGALAGCVLTGRDVMRQHVSCRWLSVRFRFSVCLWHTVYRRQHLLHSAPLLATHSLTDDYEFTPQAFYTLSRLLVLDDVLYLVRETPQSITRSANPRKAYDYLLTAAHLHQFAVQAPATDRRWLAVFPSIALCNSLEEAHRAGISRDAAYLDAWRRDRDAYGAALWGTRNAKFQLMAVLLRCRVALLVQGYLRLLWGNPLKRLGHAVATTHSYSDK